MSPTVASASAAELLYLVSSGLAGISSFRMVERQVRRNTAASNATDAERADADLGIAAEAE